MGARCQNLQLSTIWVGKKALRNFLPRAYLSSFVMEAGEEKNCVRDAQVSLGSDVWWDLWAKVHCPYLVVRIELGRASSPHTVAANAASIHFRPQMVPVLFRLPASLLQLAQCCSLREENFNGSVVTQPGADQCLWGDHTSLQSRLKRETLLK